MNNKLLVDNFYLNFYITLWPSDTYEGQRANRTDIGRIRNITGIIKEISALPAAVKREACCPALTSSTCLFRTSDNEEPRSIAKINVSQNRRTVVELTCAPKTSSD